MDKGSTTGFFRECSNPKCAFRYPDLKTDSEIAYCPKCGAMAPISCRIGSIPENHIVSISHIEIIPFLDNIRSVYNVGSIIRTCEGLGIKEIILSGITPSPDHPRMNKTGLGAIPNIKWHHINNGLHEVNVMKSNGFQIISLESSLTALPINQVLRQNLHERICLILGNENLGVDPKIQKLSDLVVAIPMAGEKESFNVSVAFGIAAYHFVAIA
jgi:tRNA G18 (ribose-2'-O)-methylase SpoU